MIGPEKIQAELRKIVAEGKVSRNGFTSNLKGGLTHDPASSCNKPESLLTPGVIGEIGAAMWWLGEVTPERKGFNPSHSTYGYKHDAERYMGGYIANGSLIAAAMIMGLSVRQLSGSLNGEMKLSEKRLKAVEIYASESEKKQFYSVFSPEFWPYRTRFDESANVGPVS
jgi:hypothetical protein